ncbi:helix-turn-helix domain-containing protein [Streptomyces anulatus]
MTLDFRADEPVVGLARQRQLIEAVLNASSADETRWLEWKSHLDVSKPEAAFAVAKAILGFANRMPDVAKQWTEGHAYLLVGVQENEVQGVPPHDIEKVDPWLGRYLGDFGRYQFTYVPFDNGEGTRHVMLVDVFPPRWGDPVHTLHKEFGNAYPGTIFHRYAGKTQPARPAEVQALVERARRAATRVNVGITAVAGTVALVPDTQDIRDCTRAAVRENLLKPLEAARPAKVSKAAAAFMPALAEMTDTYNVLRTLGHQDHRSPEEFREQVEAYLLRLDQAMQQSLLQAVGAAGTPLALQLVNPGEENLTKVEVVLRLPDTVLAHAADDDEEVDWPEPPQEYGTAAFPIGAGAIAGLAAIRPAAYLPPPLYAPDIQQEDGRTVIRFAPVHLRPHETVTLDPITLYTTQDVPDDTVAGEWHATATNVAGRTQQALLIPTQRLGIDVEAAIFTNDDDREE